MVRFLSWERTLSYLIAITYLLGSSGFVMDRALFFLPFITEPPLEELRAFICSRDFRSMSRQGKPVP